MSFAVWNTSFSAAAAKPKRSRVSLYLLEEGEHYVSDALAVYYAPPLTPVTDRGKGAAQAAAETLPIRVDLEGRQEVRGKLRLGTRSFLFDPDDPSLPIYRFAFRLIGEEELQLRRRADAESELPSRQTSTLPSRQASTLTGTGLGSRAPSTVYGGGGAACNFVFCFHCTHVSAMMEGGHPRPYRRLLAEGPHMFSLLWEKPEAVLPRLNSFLAASRGPQPGAAAQQLLRRRWAEVPFDLAWLGSIREKVLSEEECARVLPLLQERGRVVLSDQAIYFQSHECCDAASRVTRVTLADVRRLDRRRWNLRQCAVELQCQSGTVLFLALDGVDQCRRFWSMVSGQPAVRLHRANDLDIMLHRWQEGDISSLDYLMYLNWISGRSTNDISAYPVLPWVISDYTSASLDLADPAVYRDLSKPIGALSEQRLAYFRRRMAESGEPYLYGTHYSCPGHVLYFLFREHPLWMLRMHGGSFDKGGRLFDSVPACWASVTTQPHDLKELIPEFYFGNGAFLNPGDHGDLGRRDDGSPVRAAVELPPWAASAADFVRTLRAALEGEVCSAHLHQWIDLVFGHLSRGEAALEASNLFHPLTYDAAAEAERVADNPEALGRVEAQAAEFGQCPRQLFTRPHPPRRCPRTPEDRIDPHNYLPPDSDQGLAHPLTPLIPAPGVANSSPRGGSAADAAQGAARAAEQPAPAEHADPAGDTPAAAVPLAALLGSREAESLVAPAAAALGSFAGPEAARAAEDPEGDGRLRGRSRTAPSAEGRRHLLRAAAAALRLGGSPGDAWQIAPAVGGFSGGGDDRACASPTSAAWGASDESDSRDSDAGAAPEAEPPDQAARWADAVGELFLKTTDTEMDDMVWFVRRKGTTAGKRAFVRRRTDRPSLPALGDRTVAWRPSLLLNIAVQWEYEMTVALVHEPPRACDGTHWSPDWVSTRVYASPAADTVRGGCDSYQVTYPDLYFSAADPAESGAQIRVPPGAWMWAVQVSAVVGKGKSVPLLRACLAHVELARRVQLISKQGDRRAVEYLIVGGEGPDHQTVQVAVSASESEGGGKWWKGRGGSDARDSPLRCSVQWVAASCGHITAALLATTEAAQRGTALGAAAAPWLTLPAECRRDPSAPPPAPDKLPRPPDGAGAEELGGSGTRRRSAGPSPHGADAKLSPTDFAAFWEALSPEEASRIDAGGSIDDAIRRWVQAGRPLRMRVQSPPVQPSRGPPPALAGHRGSVKQSQRMSSTPPRCMSSTPPLGAETSTATVPVGGSPVPPCPGSTPGEGSRAASAAVEGEEQEDVPPPAAPQSQERPPQQSQTEGDSSGAARPAAAAAAEVPRTSSSPTPSSQRRPSAASIALLYRPQTMHLERPASEAAARRWMRCFEQPPRLDEVAPGSDYQGWAAKKGGVKRGPLARGYSQRLFVIRGSYMFYFGVFSPDATAKGCVFLYQARLRARSRRGSPSQVLEVCSPVPRHPHGVTDKGGDEERVFCLAFDSEEERTEFAYALAPGALELLIR